MHFYITESRKTQRANWIRLYTMHAMDAAYVLLVVLVVICSTPTPPPCLAAGATDAELTTWKCNNRTSYAPNDTYQSNVRALIASLAANASRSVGFANGSFGGGGGRDTAWGVALCRGDTNGTACASCLSLSTGVAFGQCLGARDVSAFYDRCLLRFSDEDFLSVPDNTQVQLSGSSKDSVTGGSREVERFGSLVAYLLGALSDLAAFNTTSRYAVGVVSSDEGFLATTKEVVHGINGMVQCTPEQASAACRGCLQGLMYGLAAAASSNGSIGGQINAVWCRLRYEVGQFYDGSPMLRLAAPPPTPSPSSTDKGNGTKGRGNAATTTIAIVLGVVVILLSVFTIFLWRNNTKASREQASANEEDDQVGTSLLFDLATLRCATSDFAEQNKLGHGGFGAVYKGLLPDGREIAVKRLDKASRQGLKELKNELLLVVKLRHNNLAKLLGVCVNGQEKLLVYEYLPNRSLDIFLFKHPEEPLKSEPLDWHTRYRIIYGVARGLLYLHEDSQAKIIHRDLKASNILLDGDMTPKISDFGLARLFDSDKMTTITSQVVGTLGYMAPEYAVFGHLSVKLDVYSFGVLILEIITGRRNTDVFESVQEEPSTLLSYVWDHWSKGTPSEAMDEWLQRQAPVIEVLKCLHLGLLCIQENPVDRPTMLKVLIMLHGDASSFESLSRPAFIYPSSGIDSSRSCSRDLGGQQVVTTGLGSINSISVSEFHPR
ncbi:putative receptor-like protein kinase At4g00960 isoform X2 [Oryza brachyantha]|uniref:putative receptor-like protein kinase At4g00960 isoform X2 n=1 Tax=Oryza brachyantha TaxID=4533 RepID=UPI001ADAD9F9|nr:putative receptor-like protein kinase At4g00960 isoform X2 [Oryza brachyantha]